MAKRIYKKHNFSKDTICGKWNYSVWVADDHILEYHTPKWNGCVGGAYYCRFNKKDASKGFYDENGNFSYENVEDYACARYRTITDAINDNRM